MGTLAILALAQLLALITAFSLSSVFKSGVGLRGETLYHVASRLLGPAVGAVLGVALVLSSILFCAFNMFTVCDVLLGAVHSSLTETDFILAVYSSVFTAIIIAARVLRRPSHALNTVSFAALCCAMAFTSVSLGTEQGDALGHNATYNGFSVDQLSRNMWPDGHVTLPSPGVELVDNNGSFHVSMIAGTLFPSVFGIIEAFHTSNAFRGQRMYHLTQLPSC